MITNGCEHNKPLISIIIPIFNVGEFIEECIESIIKQHGNDIEIIAVNDGSTDNSGEIIDKLAKKDNRIKTIHILNSGVSVARNVGIENANGEWLWFIDGDDYIQKDSFDILRRAINTAKNLKADTIIHGGYYVKDGKEYLMGIGDPRLIQIDEILRYLNVNQIGMVLFSKNLIDLHNLRFLVGAKTAQDMHFWALYRFVFEKPIMIDQALYRYRFRESSTVKSLNYHNLACTTIPRLAKDLIFYYQNNKIQYSQYRVKIIYDFLHATIAPLGYANRKSRNLSKKEIKSAIKAINNNDLKKIIDWKIKLASISPSFCRFMLHILWFYKKHTK